MGGIRSLRIRHVGDQLVVSRWDFRRILRHVVALHLLLANLRSMTRSGLLGGSMGPLMAVERHRCRELSFAGDWKRCHTSRPHSFLDSFSNCCFPSVARIPSSQPLRPIGPAKTAGVFHTWRGVYELVVLAKYDRLECWAQGW